MLHTITDSIDCDGDGTEDFHHNICFHLLSAAQRAIGRAWISKGQRDRRFISASTTAVRSYCLFHLFLGDQSDVVFVLARRGVAILHAQKYSDCLISRDSGAHNGDTLAMPLCGLIRNLTFATDSDSACIEQLRNSRIDIFIHRLRFLSNII